jgi:hypothetical protein
MRIQKALIDDTISAKKAGLLLYSLQLGITNIGQTTFGEADERDLATNLVDEQDALNEERLEFTAKDAETAKESRSNNGFRRDGTETLPQISRDERGLETEEVSRVVRMRM